MGVLGQSKDKGAAAVIPHAQAPVDKTGFFQNVGAGFRATVAGPHSTRVGTAISEKNLYDGLIKSVQSEGEQGTDYVPSPVRRDSPFYHPVEGERVNPNGVVYVPVKRGFRNPYVSGPSLTATVNPIEGLYLGGDRGEREQIWGAIQRIRQRKPDFLKQFPNEGALSAYALQQRQKQVQAAQSVTERAGTMGTVGNFIGSMGGSIASLDPENAVGAGFGTAAGKTFARTVIKRSTEGAGANAAAAIVGAPGVVQDAQHLGQEMTPDDIKRQVGVSAGIGALFGAAPVLAPKVGRKAAGVVSAVTDKVTAVPVVRDALVAASIRAGTVKDRSLLGEWIRTHNPGGSVDTHTPDERAAAHTILRDVENKEVSPLHPEDAQHNEERLHTIAHTLGVDLSVPEVPTPVQKPTVRDREGGRKPASYEEAVHHAEGTTRNPDSTADGHFQFIDSTWMEYAPRVTDTKGMSRQQILALRHDRPTAEKAERLFRGDNAKYLRARGIEDSPGNLSLAHFLGKSDAAKVLSADPSTPIERLVDPASLRANRKVMQGKSASELIAWAHKRIGAAVDSPVARAGAVGEADPLDAADYSETPYERATFTPDQVETDAALMQYKSGGDEAGVTGKLRDEPAWDPNKSGELLVWETNEGRRVLVDGHQRLDLARREGVVEVPTVVIREADGFTADQARAIGAGRNISLGTGSVEDGARVLADNAEMAEALKPAPNRNEIEVIAQLPYEQFGAVLNGEADPQAAIRRAAEERTAKLAQQIRDYWSFQKENGHRRKPIQVVTTPEGTIRTWAASASERAVERDFRNGDTITRLRPDEHAALDALLEARNVETPVTGGAAEGRSAGEPSGEARGRDAAAASDVQLSSRNEPSLYDHAVAARQTAEAFSDPVGEGAKSQAEIIDHDLRMDAANPKAEPLNLFDLPETGFRLSEEGEHPQALAEIMQEAEADELAAQAIRDCLK